MKNFKNFEAKKYETAAYKKIEDGIYQIEDTYVTSYLLGSERKKNP